VVEPVRTPLRASNARLKDLRRLSRRSERSERRLFLAEGPNAVAAAVARGCAVEVFARPDATDLVPDGATATLVEDRALALLCDSVTPAGVVALCEFLDVGVPEVLTGPLVAICAEVRDPGNAGAVLRCADAAGAAGVVLAGRSVDLYNPKTLRASAGSAFHLPVAVEPENAAAVRAAREAGFTVLAADGSGERDLYDDGLYAGPVAWLFGNEAWGLPEEVAALADHRVAIPIRGRAESLNLATAAALCLYESTRPRGRTVPG
jgi:RNA methyltransferase, TrmH family